MSDHTTETVREDLVQTSSWRFRPDEIGPAFDRWLANRDKEVAARARNAALNEVNSALHSIRDKYLPGYPSRKPLTEALVAVRALRVADQNGEHDVSEP